jgi:hypothetical protein
MTEAALMWIVVTLLPGGDYETRPYLYETSCRAVAEAFERINTQTGNGKHSACAHVSEAELAASRNIALLLR